MATAEIITIGTELLLGEIVDTNTRFIARALRELGVGLYRTTTIGDNLTRIAAAIREARTRASIVITTGGLGPTVDDPTRQAVADAFGLPLEFREQLWQQISDRVRRFGREPGENQKRQAYVPVNAVAIPNPVGTAPAFLMDTPDGVVVSLPGVPNEMETLLLEAVLPYLQQRFDLREAIRVRVLHTAGLGESLVDERVGDLEEAANPTVGLAAHSGIVDVRITARAGSRAEADALIAAVEADVRQRLGAAVFGADDDRLEQVALRAVREQGWSLAAFESGLDGALVRRLAGLPVPVQAGACQPGELLQALTALRERSGSDAALGIAIFPQDGQTNIELALITPRGTSLRPLSYGGHPRNAPRWAVNTGLTGCGAEARNSEPPFAAGGRDLGAQSGRPGAGGGAAGRRVPAAAARRAAGRPTAGHPHAHRLPAARHRHSLLPADRHARPA